jgi:hypothetical protein
MPGPAYVRLQPKVSPAADAEPPHRWPEEHDSGDEHGAIEEFLKICLRKEGKGTAGGERLSCPVERRCEHATRPGSLRRNREDLARGVQKAAARDSGSCGFTASKTGELHQRVKSPTVRAMRNLHVWKTKTEEGEKREVRAEKFGKSGGCRRR